MLNKTYLRCITKRVPKHSSYSLQLEREGSR